MKKPVTKAFFSLLFLSFIGFSSLFLYTSCAKNTECKGTITVLDKVTGLPVSGATVELKATGSNGKPGQVTDTQTTDGSGKTYHTFKLQAIFDVIVTKGAQTGSGIIKLEPGQTVEVTVKIQ